MKHKLLLLVFPLLFFSCATVRNTASELKSKETIYYHETIGDIMIAVHGELLDDGSIRMFYPGTPEYENAQIFEISFEEVPSYYVLNNKTLMVSIYNIVSRQNEELKVEMKAIKPVLLLEGNIAISGINVDEVSSNILVDKSRKLWPERFGKKELTGTWTDSVKESNPRKFTFGDNGFFKDENYVEDEFYKTQYYPYEKLSDNIISVQYDIVSKISGTVINYVKLYYYDGNNIYDIIFPLKNVSDDKEVQKAIRQCK